MQNKVSKIGNIEILQLFLLFLSSQSVQSQSDELRREKLLNVFNIVKFPNDGCNTTAGRTWDLTPATSHLLNDRELRDLLFRHGVRGSGRVIARSVRLGVRCVLHLQWRLRGNNSHQQHLLHWQRQWDLALPVLSLQGVQWCLSDQAQLRHLRDLSAQHRRPADCQHGVIGRPEDSVLGSSVQVSLCCWEKTERFLQCDGSRPCSSSDLRLQQGSSHDSWLVF